MTRRVTLTDNIETMDSESNQSDRYFISSHSHSDHVSDIHQTREPKSDLRQFLNRLQTVDHSHQSDPDPNTQLGSNSSLQRSAPALSGNQLRTERMEPYIKPLMAITPKEYPKIEQQSQNVDIDSKYELPLSSRSAAALGDMYTREYGTPRMQITPQKYGPSYFDEVSPLEKSSEINSDRTKSEASQLNYLSSGRTTLESTRQDYKPSYSGTSLLGQNRPPSVDDTVGIAYTSSPYNRIYPQIPISIPHRIPPPNYLPIVPLQPLPPLFPISGMCVDPWPHPPPTLIPPNYVPNNWTTHSLQYPPSPKLNPLPPKNIPSPQVRQELTIGPHGEEPKRTVDDRYSPPLLPPIIIRDEEIKVSSMVRNGDQDRNILATNSMQRIGRIPELLRPDVNFDRVQDSYRIDERRQEILKRSRSPPSRLDIRLGKRATLDHGDVHRELSHLSMDRDQRRRSPHDEYAKRMQEENLRLRKGTRESVIEQPATGVRKYDYDEYAHSQFDRVPIREISREREIHLKDVRSRIPMEHYENKGEMNRDYNEYRRYWDEMYMLQDSRGYRSEDPIRYESDLRLDLRAHDNFRDVIPRDSIDSRDKRYFSHLDRPKDSPVQRKQRDLSLSDLKYENRMNHSGRSLSPYARRSSLERMSDRDFRRRENEGRVGRSFSREREVTRVQYQRDKLRSSPSYRPREETTRILGSPRYMKSETSRLDISHDSSIISPIKLSSRYGDSPVRKIIPGHSNSEKVTHSSQSRHSRSPKRQKRASSLMDLDEGPKSKDSYINLLLDERLPFQSLDERKKDITVVSKSPGKHSTSQSRSISQTNIEKSIVDVGHIIGPCFPKADSVQGSGTKSKSVQCPLCKCVVVATRYEKHIVEKCTNRLSPNKCPYCHESYDSMRSKPLQHIETCLQKSLTCPFCTVKLESTDISHLLEMHVDEKDTHKFKTAMVIHKLLRKHSQLELDTVVSSTREDTQDELMPMMKRIFKCPSCPLIGLIDTLREHYSTTHLIYKCIHCQALFSNPDKFPEHLAICQKNSPTVCSLCDKHNRHSNIHSLAKHIMHFHKTITCPICRELQEIYRFKGHVHWCLFSNWHRVTCPSCNISVKLSEVADHLLYYHPRSYCPFCQVPLTSKGAHEHLFQCLKAQPSYTHIELTQLTRDKCPYCDVLMAPHLLVTHILQSHDTYSVRCSFCGDFYTNRRDYSNHVGLCCQKVQNGNLPVPLKIVNIKEEIKCEQKTEDDVI